MTLKGFLKFLYLFITSLQSFKPRLLFNSLVSIFAFCFLFFYFYVLSGLPSPRSLSQTPVPLTTHIRDRNGQTLYKIYKDQNRTLVKLSDLPLHLTHAVLVMEDKNFYRHNGFSLRDLLRALFSNIKCQVLYAQCQIRLQGGSTITQQLVKTSLLSSKRTLQRKLKELVLSLTVEFLYSKDQILEMYLNRVSFGGTAFGVEEAAHQYFGKPAAHLSLAESALLAGLPAAPTTYSPFGAHPELAKIRQTEVLRRLAENKFISWDEAEATASQQLGFRPPAPNIKAPHFVMFVKEILSQKYGSDIVEQGGLDVTTSLDLPLQSAAEKIISQELAKISRLQVGNAAVLVTYPPTGEILAMVGSKNYFDIANDGNFNVTTALRQPGSSIKPINYALAFSRGFTPASVIDDSPVTYYIPGQPPYSPTNYDRRYHGRVTLRTALASSYNVPAVKLLAANGVDNMVQLGSQMGITTWTDPARFGLSLTLGGGEVKMTDLATAYGVFANSGHKVDLYPILSVRDSQGHILEQSDHRSSTAVLDPRIAFIISDILSDNSARSPAFGSRSQLVIPGHPVAVKTGTTNNLKDNWTIGYTPKFLTAVWVGNNDGSPMSYVASGVTGASPIWNQIMTHLLQDQPPLTFTPPSGLNRLRTCSGKIDYFLSGTTPPPCPTPTPTPNESQILPAITAPPQRIIIPRRRP